jgi:hypothetical protein
MPDQNVSRGEMIRRLDEAENTAAAKLGTGPLSQGEQHAIAASLADLLPLVADSVQDQLEETAGKLLEARGRRG